MVLVVKWKPIIKMRNYITCYIALFWMLCSCRAKVNEEIYLIPNHFIGNVIIVYDQPNGKADSIVNKKAIYKIPKNGVLYLKGKQYLQDLKFMKYYYYDNPETKVEICRMDYDSLNNCKTIVYNNRTESYGWTSDPKQITYSIITIGTKDSIPTVFDPAIYFR